MLPFGPVTATWVGVKHVSDRIMLIKLVIGKSIVTVLPVYAPQAGLDYGVKDKLLKSAMDTEKN